MKKVLKLVFIVFLLSSCEGGTDLNKVFVNNTDADIRLEVFNNFTGSASDIIQLGPHSKVDYFAGGGIGQFFDYEDCLVEIDSIKVSIVGGERLLKDIMNPENWIKETESNRNNSNIFHECTFEINPEDIE